MKFLTFIIYFIFCCIANLSLCLTPDEIAELYKILERSAPESRDEDFTFAANPFATNYTKPEQKTGGSRPLFSPSHSATVLSPFHLDTSSSVNDLATHIHNSLFKPIDVATNLTKNLFKLPSKLLEGKLSSFLLGEGKKLPAVFDDFLIDLQKAIINTQFIHQTLIAVRDLAALPITVVTYGVQDIFSAFKKENEPATLADLGVGGLHRMAEAVRKETAGKVRTQGYPQAFQTAESYLGGPDRINTLISESAGLLDQLDAVLITLSDGAESSIKLALQQLQAVLQHFVTAPSQAISWLETVKILDFTRDRLANIINSWRIRDVVATPIKQLLKQIENLINYIINLRPPLQSLSVTYTAEELADIYEKLRQLNGITLVPAIISDTDTRINDLSPVKVPVFMINVDTPGSEEFVKTIAKAIRRLADLPAIVLDKPALSLENLTLATLVTTLTELTGDLLNVSYTLEIAQGVAKGLPVAVFETAKSFVELVDITIRTVLKRLFVERADKAVASFSMRLNEFTDQAQRFLPFGIVFPYFEPTQRKSQNRLLGEERTKQEAYSEPQQQKDYLTEWLPLLESEMRLYERLRSSECSSMTKQLKPGRLEASIHTSFAKEAARVCDDVKLLALRYEFLQLVKTNKKLQSSVQYEQRKFLEQDLEKTVVKFLRTLQEEKSLAKERASLLSKLQSITKTSQKSQTLRY